MKTTHVYIALVVILVIGIIVVRNNVEPAQDPATAVSTELDAFAQCLTDAGAKFYGAFWCPHCKEQKTLLKNSTKLPYIECSTPDKKGQFPICVEQKITGYPTWTFADGTREERVLTLDALASKTNCALPQPQ